MKIIGLIPARMESSRLPGKPLLDILGMPMVIHVAKRSLLSKQLDMVVVCTDSIEIVKMCIKNDIKCILTKDSHQNGTERIAEAVKNISTSDNDIFIDIQGDEPLLHPGTIDRLIGKFMESNFDIMLPFMYTSSTNNENIVKMSTVKDKVIYLSRSDIPYSFSKEVKLKKHLSIIAFTKKALEKYCSLEKLPIEQAENIELLRALENNLTIGTFREEVDSFSVDVKSDYQKAIRQMRDDTFYKEYRKGTE